MDMEPRKPGQVFALFWRKEMFEKMRNATNTFGRLYVKRFTKEISFDEHFSWFKQASADPLRHLLILKTAVSPAKGSLALTT
jgi:hypothetical protein